MSIRRKIFSSYIILVSIVVVYAVMLMLSGIIQKRIDEDISELYKSKEIWNDLLISMNELPINWADGKTYKTIKEKYNNLEKLLKGMSEESIKKTFLFDYSMNSRKTALYASWSIANRSILSIIDIIDSIQFQKVIQIVEKQPGLQRLNHIWIKQLETENFQVKRDAYLLSQVIDKIEFFPIYSETLNHLFNVIISEADEITNLLSRIRFIGSGIFFILFLSLYMIFALRFSNSISKPIINLSIKLSSFMGKTLKYGNYSHTNELHLLTLSISNLIEHYTYLSELAGQLAVGDISTPILELKGQGVIGNALKDINEYLQELAKTSQWIKDGNYGAKVRVKSENDRLAMNFNIMSQVISEQISTLRNMFETVEESIVVIDFEGKIIEVNNKFIQLTNPDLDFNKFNKSKNISQYFENQMVLGELKTQKDGKNIYQNIIDSRNNLIPVKLISRSMPEIAGQENKLMLFIKNESLRVRVEREKEELRSHAVEAELRALRAQINPHFLFNTLNAIAHLVEIKSEGAVQMIEKLSELFRYSLASTRRNTVPLSEELDIIHQYLEIEKMRFGNSLSVKYSIEDKLENIDIPPMLIQPIVENAVKYGINNKGNINITIKIYHINKSLHISVTDNGSQVVNHQMLLERKGTGIRNVNQRLKSLYNNQLKFLQNDPQGLKVIIEIPEDGSRYDTNSYY